MALAMLKELFAHKCQSKYGREIQRKVQVKQVTLKNWREKNENIEIQRRAEARGVMLQMGKERSHAEQLPPLCLSV